MLPKMITLGDLKNIVVGNLKNIVARNEKIKKKKKLSSTWFLKSKVPYKKKGKRKGKDKDNSLHSSHSKN